MKLHIFYVFHKFQNRTQQIFDFFATLLLNSKTFNNTFRTQWQRCILH